jgi:hypothetical protein
LLTCHACEAGANLQPLSKNGLFSSTERTFSHTHFSPDILNPTEFGVLQAAEKINMGGVFRSFVTGQDFSRAANASK